MTYAFNRALAVVPARGGSKRVQRKNLRLLGDKPLVCHTLDAAISSDCFAGIILSSDDPEILDFANRYKEVKALPRDSRWSGDKVTVFEFLHHMIKDNKIATSYDVIALLLPTVPFRTAENIKEVAALLSNETDSVISLCRYDFPPQFGVYLDDKSHKVSPAFDPSPLVAGITRSQDQAPILHPNGAVFIAWLESYLRHGSFYRGNCLGCEMQRTESIDIDTEADFEYADFVMRKRNSVL